MKYLHVYRTESGRWVGLVLETVTGVVYDRATPLEVLLDAREQHQDVVDLPGAKAVEELVSAVKCSADLTPASQRIDWPCHKGITTVERCGRCSRDLRVIAALAAFGDNA